MLTQKDCEFAASHGFAKCDEVETNWLGTDDGGRDVFVHITAVERAGLKDLTEGQRITFEVEPDKKGKGPKAVNLVISS